MAKERASKTPTLTPIVKEVGIFGIGFGLMVFAFGAIGTFGDMKGLKEVPSLFVILAIFMMFFLPGIMNIAGGILTLTKRSKTGILLCMAGSIMFSVLFLGTLVLGGLRFNCVTVLLIAIPILVCLRSAKAMDELKAAR